MTIAAVQHLDVFVGAPGGGNPCPIVVDAGDLTTAQMQAIAAHYGHESGFIERDGDGGLRLRYFVPRHEMSMCVHATVAAITVLVAAGTIDGGIDGGEVVARTGSGDCRITWDDAVPPRVTVEQQAPQFGPALEIARELEPATGLPVGAIDDEQPVRWVSVSRPKLIVPVRTAADVHAATPDLAALWSICRDHDTTGAYLFAPHSDGRPGHVVARQFPVDAGYPEDPATGVAAAALAAYVAAAGTTAGWLTLDIEQGEAMGRPSRLQAAAFADAGGVQRSTVSGTAEFRAPEQLDLADLGNTRPDESR